MAAGEDEAQPIVLDALLVRPRRRVDDPRRLASSADLVERIEARPAANAVDRLEACRPRPAMRAGSPGRRSRGHCSSAARKASCSASSADVEVAEQPNQRRENPPRLGDIDGVYRLGIGSVAATATDHTTFTGRAQAPAAVRQPACSQPIIHGTPKRSTTIPNPSDQNVFSNGIRTVPFSDSALNVRSASSGDASVTETSSPRGAL